MTPAVKFNLLCFTPMNLWYSQSIYCFVEVGSDEGILRSSDNKNATNQGYDWLNECGTYS